MYRYYSTKRPIAPGSVPSKNIIQVVNFDNKSFCEEIAAEAWGYVEYSKPLASDQASSYELQLAGVKMYWAVTTAFYDDGTVVASITDICRANKKPDSFFKSTSRKDVYVDWFDSESEAKKYVADAKRA